MFDESMIAVTAFSAARAFLAAAIATGLGVGIASASRRMKRGPAGVLWVLLVGAIVSPDLVAGYAYANFSLSLARLPIANEAFLTLLIACKTTAVGAVIAMFAPPPALSPGGRHLLRLAGARVSWRTWFHILLRGRFDRWGPVGAIAFLYAFGQFELPSLTNATAWTVRLFDRQALLPDLAESADPLVWPLLVEFLVLVPLVICLARAVRARRRSVEPAARSVVSRGFAWLAVVLIVIFSVVIPWSILTWEASGGAGYFRQGGPAVASYVRQISTALMYGILSGGLAWLVAVGILRLAAKPRWRIPAGVVLVLISIPGLCGSLVPSLFVLEWLQTPLLLPLRRTIVPVVFVLALMLIPRAIVLEILSRLESKQSGMGLAMMLRRSPDWRQRRAGRERLWALVGFGRYCRVSLLVYWGYLDLTVSQMLAPVGMESVTLWLYNFMHYGRNASLSAMTFVAMVIPVILFASVLLIRRTILRIR